MIVLFMLLHVLCCSAASDQSVNAFDQAQALYASGAYQAALAEFQKIPNKTGAVWYNMGCAALGMQDYTQALLYLLRAQKYGDAQTYAAAHKKLAQVAQFSAMSNQSIKDSIWYYLLLINKQIPLYMWQILVFLLWYLLWYLLMAKRGSLPMHIILLVLVAIMLVPISASYYSEKQEVLVTAESVEVFNGPNASLYNMGSLQKNTVAHLQQVKKQWYKIAHGDMIGWIERSGATKI